MLIAIIVAVAVLAFLIAICVIYHDNIKGLFKKKKKTKKAEPKPEAKKELNLSTEQTKKTEAKFDLSDVSSAIGEVPLYRYKNVQETIKDAREDKEYGQTK